MAVMYTANHLKVKAIVALTESGSTPLWMSRIRADIPIYAFTRHEETRRRVMLYRGVYPVTFDITHTERASCCTPISSSCMLEQRHGRSRRSHHSHQGRAVGRVGQDQRDEDSGSAGLAEREFAARSPVDRGVHIPRRRAPLSDCACLRALLRYAPGRRPAARRCWRIGAIWRCAQPAADRRRHRSRRLARDRQSIERDAQGTPTIRGELPSRSRIRDRLRACTGPFLSDGSACAAPPPASWPSCSGQRCSTPTSKLRIHGFRRVAEQVMAQATAERSRTARGLRGGRERSRWRSAGARPWEYLLLRSQPAPWLAEDSVLVGVFDVSQSERFDRRR